MTGKIHTAFFFVDKLALIQKVPTPITPITIDKKTHHITLAYFDQKSTVDYIGTVQGIPVCFDAKECHTDTFPLANIHEHQVKFMERFEQQQGVAFMLLYFVKEEKYYFFSHDSQKSTAPHRTHYRIQTRFLCVSRYDKERSY